MSRRAPACLALLLALLIAAPLPGCGSSFTPSATKHRDAQPVASIYDFIVSVPGLAFPQLQATGLTVDLTLEIDPAGIDASGRFDGGITINAVQVGGAGRPFTAAVPLTATGSTVGADWSVDSFGPIMIGDAASGFTSVMLSLAGTLASDGRSIQGAALVTSSGEMGTFSAIKQRRYLVAGTDFGVTGTVSLVKVRFDTAFVVQSDLEAISGDPVVRAGGGRVQVVNRYFFDNVQSLDPASGYKTALQFSTGNGSNPHDALAVDPNRLYVTRYEPPFNDVLIADADSGAWLGFIDLSPLAMNATGTPRPDAAVQAEGLVFVGLQDIDASFLEYGPGRVAVIDPATDAVVAAITLQGVNPFGPPAMHPLTGDLYYATAGIFQGSLPRALTGGIEVVDPRTLATRGLLVDDDDLGGNVSGVAVAAVASGSGPARAVGWCVVTDAAGTNAIRSFDPDTGAVAPGAVYQSASFLTEVVSDGDGYILVPAHDLNDPRLLILDAATGRLVASPRLSLPPFSVAVLTRDLIRR